MPRNAMLDHARLAAALGILWFHAGAPGAGVAYAALPFFAMLLVVLAVPAAARRGFADHAGERARRLLVPWACWSAVYGGLKLGEVALTGRPLAAEFAPFMLLTGPALHLWFLPFAFAAALAVWPLAQARPGPAARAALAGALAAGALAALLLPGRGTWPVPAAQWLHTLPAVLIGAGFALAGPRPGAVAGMAAAALAAAAAGWAAGAGPAAAQTGLAALALAACLALRLPETALSRQAAALALGVYLAHPLVAALAVRLLPVEPKGLAVALVTAAGSLALAGALAALPAALRRRARPAAAPGLPARA